MAFTSLTARINALAPDNQRLWGSMSTGQMLTHCTDQVRVVLQEKPAKSNGIALTRWLAKWFVLIVPLPLPKNIKTFPEIDPDQSQMTRPGDFSADRQSLLDALSWLENVPAQQQLTHPIFGTMTKSEAIKLTHIHLDHHMRQFGV